MLLAKLALKELLRSRKFAIYFLLNVSVGLSGLILLDSFKTTFNDHLMERSKKLLGADFSVGGRIKLSDEKKQKIYEIITAKKKVSIVDMFSMVRTKETSRLVYLNQLDSEFPFYGGLQLKSGTLAKQVTLGDDEIWVYPELLFQLKLEIGESVQIGTSHFVISDVVADDPAQTFQMGSIAPKLFISSAGIKKANLMKKGSTAFYTTYYQTPAPISEAQEQQIIELVDDTALRVTTPLKASEQVGRMINYLSDFLGLVSLVALFLSIVGIFYLYRSYLFSKRKTFAVLKSIGMSNKMIFSSQLWHIGFLTITGTFFSVGISALLLFFANQLIQQVLPFDLVLAPQLRSVGLGLGVGILGVYFVSIPLILGSLREKASVLFQEGQDSGVSLLKINFVNYLPLLSFFLLLSIFVSHSIKIGLIFMGILFTLFITLYPILNFILSKSEQKFKFKKLEHTLSFRYLTRYRLSTISIFLALFFGSLMMNFIPSLQTSLQNELDGGMSGNAPSLFLFDIQEEQVSDLKDFVKNRKQKLLSLSPLIRSRLTFINGEPLIIDNKKALTREGEREKRFQNRGINLTYRQGTYQDEKIVKGNSLSIYSGEGLPDISLEQRYADRIGVNIGDELTFDIMGIEQKAIVKNIRRVRWTSFQPNFFISFAEGVLDNAPKTFLAAIPKMTELQKAEVQRDLYDEFPNVSAVDLDRLVEKIRSILGQMSMALKVMSLLVILVGIMVVYALVNHQLSERMKDLMLLKVLGLSITKIEVMVMNEFLMISLVASSFGAFFGLLVAYIFSAQFFEGLWELEFQTPLISIFAITVICSLVSFFTSKVALYRKNYEF